jgi:hypothetical protein
MDLASSNGLWAIEDESLALAGDDAIELRAAWLIAGTLSPPIEVATRPAGLGASDSAISWMKLYRSRSSMISHWSSEVESDVKPFTTSSR